MTAQMLSFAGLVLAIIVLLIVLLIQRRQLERLREELSRQQQKPEKPDFDQSLAQAEKQPLGSRTTLDPPRSSAFQTDLAERYRCISAMARQGLGASQISAILHISEAEVRQVIRLAEVRQH
jgi:DNA-binding NarL/FixJ family response regulator